MINSPDIQARIRPRIYKVHLRAEVARKVGHRTVKWSRYSPTTKAPRLWKLLYRVHKLLYCPPVHRSHEPLSTLVSSWDGSTFSVNTASHIDWTLYTFGEFERQSLEDLLGYLDSGFTYVDCGANIGTYVCPAARTVGPFGRVIAIEPVAELAEQLNRNLKLNSLDNVTIVQKAASSSDGFAYLQMPSLQRGNLGLASIIDPPHTPEQTRSVPITTIDNLVIELGLQQVDVLKIDVEGHEATVMEGAISTIARWKPVIFFESLRSTDKANDDTSELITRLESLGYRFRPSFDGLVCALPDASASIAAK